MKIIFLSFLLQLLFAAKAFAYEYFTNERPNVETKYVKEKRNLTTTIIREITYY